MRESADCDCDFQRLNFTFSQPYGAMVSVTSFDYCPACWSRGPVSTALRPVTPEDDFWLTDQELNDLIGGV